MRLSDLNNEQYLALAAYWLLADACPPTKHELCDVPIALAGPLWELSKLTGKYPSDHHPESGWRSGRVPTTKRKPRVRRRLGQLAT